MYYDVSGEDISFSTSLEIFRVGDPNQYVNYLHTLDEFMADEYLTDYDKRRIFLGMIKSVDMYMAHSPAFHGLGTWMIDNIETCMSELGVAQYTVIDNELLVNGKAINIGDMLEGGYYTGLCSKNKDSIATHILIVAPNSDDLTKLVNFEQALEVCRHLTLNGYDDWVLPTIDELEIAYYNLKPGITHNATDTGINVYAVPKRKEYYTETQPGQCVLDIFQQGNTQAFDTGTSYWSRSMLSKEFAWNLDFNTGGQRNNNKDTKMYMRPFRYIEL